MQFEIQCNDCSRRVALQHSTELHPVSWNLTEWNSAEYHLAKQHSVGWHLKEPHPAEWHLAQQHSAEKHCSDNQKNYILHNDYKQKDTQHNSWHSVKWR